MGLAAQTRVRGEGSHHRTPVLLRKPSQGSFLLLRPRRPHAAPPPPRHAAIGERRVEGWGGFCRLPGPVSPHKGRRGRPGCGGRRRFRGSREVKGSLPGLGLGLPSTAVAARACGRRHRRSGARRGLGRPKAEASPPPGCPPPRETREAEAAPPGPGRGEEAPRAPVGLRGRGPVSYTHLTLPTRWTWCRSRWSPYH